MEVLVFLILFWTAGIWVPLLKKFLSNASNGDIGGGLQFRPRLDTVDEMNVLFLEVKGDVRVPCDGYKVNYGISVNDITGGEDHFILCALNEYQASDVPVLHIVSSLRIPHANSNISKWIPLAIIPIDALTFPKRGTREIQFELTWADENAPVRKKKLSLNVKEFGYLERAENRKKYDKFCVQLAFALSCCDGEIHKDEAHMIRNWVQNRVDLTDDESFKTEIMTLIRKEVEDFEAKKNEVTRDIDYICKEILLISTVAERYDIVELLMKITSVDKNADPRELALLDKIIKALDVDEKKMRSMRDQHIPANIISSNDDKDIDSLLGIEKSMSNSEIKKHLRAQYRKWNSLANHPDKEKREQAEYMLKLIGERRSQLTEIESPRSLPDEKDEGANCLPDEKDEAYQYIPGSKPPKDEAYKYIPD